MPTEFVIRRMVADDIDALARAFAGWGKKRPQYERYFEEQRRGERVVLVARVGDEVAGYGTLVWNSGYEPFRLEGIPEIMDLNVIEPCQRRGIGSSLIRAAEGLAAGRSKTVIGIGVGMTPDYDAARRLYPKLGYVPDGRPITPDHELYLTRRLSTHEAGP
jgi:GNAT superfamily N-acetyltransferase